MSDKTEQIEAPTISFVALADRFIEDHTRMPNRSFAFVLGAGASRASGIKPAGQMVNDWIRALYREATGHVDGDGKVWATAATLAINAYDPKDPAASYSELYHRMYARDPDRGYAYLEEQMREAEPSYGYSVLGRIMDNTRHKIVVTTNFDNLVADALSIFGSTYPLVCGHESLAGFISPRVRRPLVVKVHRDLLLGPKSDPEELRRLPDGFRDALTQLFGHYTPIVIGYGGNDGSLMGFLKDLPPHTIPGGVYWCYWDGGDPPSAEIRQFVARQNGCLVPIPGFDEIMMLLGQRIAFDVPDKYVLERANERAKRIVDQVQTLKEKLKISRHRMPDAVPGEIIAASLEESPDRAAKSVPSPDSSETDVLSQALTETMRRTSGPLRWWQWQERAEAASDVEERNRIYQEGIAALPNSHELLGNYAVFLDDIRKDHDKAEAYFVRALEAAPEDTGNLGNYALFLQNIRKDDEKSETYYTRALLAGPADANILGNYAVFLHNIRKDYDKAETYYVQALEADPRHANNVGNYAFFLQNIRKDYDKAEKYFVQALEADPGHANTLSNYAVFLDDIRKDYDKAETYYVRAVDADPGNVNTLGNYAMFLEDKRKQYDKADTYLVRALEAAPGDANTLGNMARFLLKKGRLDEGLSMLDRAFATPEAGIPEPLAVELRMYAVCHRLPEAWRASLPGLKKLLVEDEVTTGDWDFSDVIATAKTRGHPAAEWLEPLAAVCAGTAYASTLEGWDEWNRA